MKGWGVNQGVLQTKAHESSGDATPRLTSVLFWMEHDGNVMVFIKVKSPEPCHSLAYIHNHCTQKSNQIVATKSKTQAQSHNSQEILILNFAQSVCVTDGKNLSHTRSDNFPAALRVDNIRWCIWKCINFTFIINQSLRMCTFTHTSENKPKYNLLKVTNKFNNFWIQQPTSVIYFQLFPATEMDWCN